MVGAWPRDNIADPHRPIEVGALSLATEFKPLMLLSPAILLWQRAAPG